MTGLFMGYKPPGTRRDQYILSVLPLDLGKRGFCSGPFVLDDHSLAFLWLHPWPRVQSWGTKGMCLPGTHVPLTPCPLDLEPQNYLPTSSDPASKPYASSLGPLMWIHLGLKHTGWVVQTHVWEGPYGPWWSQAGMGRERELAKDQGLGPGAGAPPMPCSSTELQEVPRYKIWIWPYKLLWRYIYQGSRKEYILFNFQIFITFMYLGIGYMGLCVYSWPSRHKC